MPETAIDAMEEMTGQGDEAIDKSTDETAQPTVEKPDASTKEPDKPSEEPEKKEPEKPKEEVVDTLLPPEEMKALFDAFAPEEAIEEPQRPAYEPPSARQQQPPERETAPQPSKIPQDISDITVHKFMPQGQEYDPMDAHTPGTPSCIAAMRAEEERFNIRTARERERMRQEQIATQGAEQIDKLNARMEREKWPPALRQKFWNRMTNNPLDLDMMADSFLLSERRALRKAQTDRVAGGNGGEPPPVSKATRQIEKPRTPNEVDKEVDELFGPKREVAI